MTVFNFDLKRQSYEIALKQTQTSLSNGDVDEGKYYLSRAIELCSQLVANCVISQMRRRYENENYKLHTLLSSLERGENPFMRKISAKPSDDNAVGTDGAGGTRKNLQFFANEAPDTTLKDVAGLEEVKKQIRLRVIAPLKNPELYKRYMDDEGCQILLYGPPGCGKSFVAEAIAGELKCAYAVINASDLLEKYVGEGPKKVVQIFKEAEEFKNCLMFFDELDALFSSRESEESRHTRDVLTTFLTCLSGFHANKNSGVRVIIGATNRPWALDSALIRGKRFDTHIYVGLPDASARAFLVRKAFKKNPALLGGDIDEQKLVELFEGYSCADISSIISKMKVRAFERSLANLDKGISANEPVMLADANSVIADYRNSVTKESLEAFKAFENGEI